MSKIGICSRTGLAQQYISVLNEQDPEGQPPDIACTLSTMVRDEPERGVQIQLNADNIITLHIPSREALASSTTLTYPTLIIATPREHTSEICIIGACIIGVGNSPIMSAVDAFEALFTHADWEHLSSDALATQLHGPNIFDASSFPSPAFTVPVDPTDPSKDHPIIRVLQTSVHNQACGMYTQIGLLDLLTHACAQSVALSRSLIDTIHALLSTTVISQPSPHMRNLVSTAFPELCVGWRALTFTVWLSTQTRAVPSNACRYKNTRQALREYISVYATLFNGAPPDPLCQPAVTDDWGVSWSDYEDDDFICY